MYAYYIGENTDWINRISHCLECQVITFNNPIKTILCINEQSKKDISPTYIFIESYNKKRDLQWLNAIAQGDLKNTYLLLLSEKIAKEDIVDYLHAGTSEIVNINTTPEDLQTTLAFLPKIKRHSTVHVQNNPRRFKLPWWKRTFDILFSGTAIICLSPFLIVTALAIRIESKGPIIYKSKRVGSNYDIFDFLKFRSMYVDADKRLKEFEALNQYREETQDQQAHTETSPTSIKPARLFSWPMNFIDRKQLLKNRRKQQKMLSSNSRTIPELPKSDVSS